MEHDADWKRFSEAGAARQVIELLDDHFTETQARLDRAMFTKLEQGVAISADEALQFVYMKHANYKLMKKLHEKLASGASAASRLEPTLTGANPYA